VPHRKHRETERSQGVFGERLLVRVEELGRAQVFWHTHVCASFSRSVNERCRRVPVPNWPALVADLALHFGTRVVSRSSAARFNEPKETT
jgi:hypothetical protein